MMRTAKLWGYCTLASDDERAGVCLPMSSANRQDSSTGNKRGTSSRSLPSLIAPCSRSPQWPDCVLARFLVCKRQTSDFDRHIIQVQRSAWHGQIQTVKSKASKAPVAMAEALTTVLKEYLATWRDESRRVPIPQSQWTAVRGERRLCELRPLA